MEVPVDVLRLEDDDHTFPRNYAVDQNMGDTEQGDGDIKRAIGSGRRANGEVKNFQAMEIFL